jgi:carnitine O-palmitoyltransferase 2
MMRRCVARLAGAAAAGGDGGSSKPKVATMPADISDWSRMEAKMKAMTEGRCFDPTVFDKSIMPTRLFQNSLFRLPIPKLEDTCRKYLDCVKPIVSPADYSKTEALVKDFEKGSGASLHKELIARDKANKHTSYISDDWFHLYLADRVPLPINYNPSLVTRRDPDKPDGLVRAAYWIVSSLKWYNLYTEDRLKPEIFYFGPKGHYSRKDWFSRTACLVPRSIAAKVMMIASQFMAFPLDMSQYSCLFNCTRLPGAVKDSISQEGFHPHIIVNCRGHQYLVNVADALGKPLAVEQIYARLKAIVDAGATAPEVDVGVFTSMNRTDWHAVRTTMERNPVNAKSLKMVDTALFVLNLETDTTVDLITSKGTVAANRDFLVKNTNRWWDKSISITTTKDGALGVEFEHSWGDGVAALRYTVDCFNDSVGTSSKSLNKSANATEGIHQLQWSLDTVLLNAGKQAKAKLTAEINRMDFYVGAVDAFGKSSSIFKGVVKPDPFMQVAMQLAWWRLNTSTVSTYESASTAAFLKGRTECIRSATNESQRFTVLFDRKDVSDSDKISALIAATDKHAAISKDAKMGNGVDRHLFALKKLAENRNSGKAPDVFQDSSYKTFGSNIISTSSLFSEALVGGGFGPVSPGYGVGYAAADDSMIFNISCWRQGGPQHSAEEFAKAVYAALVDMHNIIANNPALVAEKKKK